jgi:D-glycero-alpha-D-manno-heptose-7-phosphate kinase
MNRAWREKKKFASKITDSRIDTIYENAMKAGAQGGKITGAGGGGFMIFLCEFEKRHMVASELEKLDARITPFAFEPRGMRTWLGEEVRRR